MHTCLNCIKSFNSKIPRQKFCTIKCRNAFNQRSWQKQNKKICPKCKQNTMGKLSKRCGKCWKPLTVEKCKEFTIQDYINLPSVKGKHPSWKFSHIKGFARKWNKDLTELPCQNPTCGYSKHVELAHIIPISKFSLDTKLKIVNSKKNIHALCPNCHWEFDHGFLKLHSQ